MKKILIIASSGGHLEEAMALRPLQQYYETILVTEKTSYDIHPWQNKCYILPQINRKNVGDLIRYPLFFIKEWAILHSEKPNVVISTGAMISFPMLVMAKLAGIKTIFIECMFNVDSPTMTGRLVYFFADLFIVQWESMLKFYPKALFGGRVF